MSKKSPVRIGLFVNSRVDGDYFHVFANPVIIGANVWEMQCIDAGKDVGDIPYNRIRNASDDLVNGLALGHLRVVSQGENATDRRGHLYGFGVEYRDVFSIDRRTAEGMAKTLKAIEARMAKLDNKFGRPATFGQYVGRVANAIGAKFIVHGVGKPVHWSYAENEHRLLELADGINYVDGLVREWAEPRQQAEAS